MELWLVLLLYAAGLSLIIAEAFMPGVVMGIAGVALLGTAVVFGFRHHWALGTGQVALALFVGPASIVIGVRRLTLRSTLGGSGSFAQDYSVLAGKEGETSTELRPAGIVMIEGKKVDVVTAGEMVERGRRVRVVMVEGNRIVVRAV